MADTISLYTNLSGTVRNKRQDRILNKPANQTHKMTMTSKPSPKSTAGIGRVITLADGSETTQVLSDAKIQLERKRRGRLPHGFGTAKYDELMSKHRALKKSQAAERNAKIEARSQKRELSDSQAAFIERELAKAGGHPVDCAGRLLEVE